MPRPVHTFGLALLIGLALVMPFGARAAGPSPAGNWLSGLFDWHISATNHFSSLFRNRKKNATDNSAAREQLLAERVASSTAPMTLDQFEEKKIAILSQLTIALNGLKASRADLADLAAPDALAQADADMSAADAAVNALADYEPQPDANGFVSVNAAQSGLDAAISDIQTARADLESAIRTAADSNATVPSL